MEEAQQHLAMGDELAAATAHDPLTGLLAGTLWDSALGTLGARLMEQANQLNTAVPQLTEIFTPLLDFGIHEANAEVSIARKKLIEARIAFIDASRDAIAA